MIEIICWRDFCEAIAPLWKTEPQHIPIINNPYRVIQYPLEDWPRRILYFCTRYSENGNTLGYSSYYNVSDRVVRVRGVYILPEHQGHGAGHRMIREALDTLFPSGFDRLVGFYREGATERFIRHSRMAPVPGVDWLWSDYLQMRLQMLYFDRPSDGSSTDRFIEANIAQFGYGGSNNLATSWSPEEWKAFATPHAFTYPDAHIKLDF